MVEPEIHEPPKMGRPSEFSDDIFAEICERMAAGGTLRKICQDDHLPSRETVIRWVRNDDGRRKLYELARQAQADWYADEIVELSRDRTNDTFTDKDGRQSSNHAAVSRDKLICDNLKFLMAKLHPGRYGEKTQMELAPVETEKPTIIVRWSISPVRADDGSIIDPDDNTKLHYRIEELEKQLAEARGEAPPSPPKLLAYDPGPLPSRLDPDVLVRLVDTFKRSLPQDDQRPPETVLDEATTIIEAALREHYGTANV